MKIFLPRDYKGTDCSMGVLKIMDHEWQTIERPWVPRAGAPCGTKGVSCVPPGTYQLWKHNSESHPKTWALVNPSLWVYHYDEDVSPGQVGIARTLVLLHPANWAMELRGCMAPGLSRLRETSGRRQVVNSVAAMNQIKDLLPWENGHELEIT